MLAGAGTDMLVMVREQEQQVVATRLDTRELCRLNSVLLCNINKLRARKGTIHILRNRVFGGEHQNDNILQENFQTS